jgi:hypothetical protein
MAKEKIPGVRFPARNLEVFFFPGFVQLHILWVTGSSPKINKPEREAGEFLHVPVHHSSVFH